MTDSHVPDKPEIEPEHDDDDYVYKKVEDHLKIQVKLTNAVEFLCEGPCAEVQSAYDKFTASGERRRGVRDSGYDE